MSQSRLYQDIFTAIGMVRDPSTGMAVKDLPLVKDVVIAAGGVITITLEPSSSVCPLIFKLGSDIKQAVVSLDGVQKVRFIIHGHQQQAMVEEYLSDE
ncbi:MAG: DUF59 domain-containing protein [Deltaproteobacteria bacterium]|nr:DUF59 domain-containing protein [Candidatus Anaeroferrophillus wilburensis]MBN2888700.1 DUF59 domain-containing protein [Deltaproteobacteria bacterium]